jgi:hypothetical protein
MMSRLDHPIEPMTRGNTRELGVPQARLSTRSPKADEITAPTEPQRELVWKPFWS